MNELCSLLISIAMEDKRDFNIVQVTWLLHGDFFSKELPTH